MRVRERVLGPDSAPAQGRISGEVQGELLEGCFVEWAVGGRESVRIAAVEAEAQGATDGMGCHVQMVLPAAVPRLESPSHLHGSTDLAGSSDGGVGGVGTRDSSGTFQLVPVSSGGSREPKSPTCREMERGRWSHAYA